MWQNFLENLKSLVQIESKTQNSWVYLGFGLMIDGGFFVTTETKPKFDGEIIKITLKLSVRLG